MVRDERKTSGNVGVYKENINEKINSKKMITVVISNGQVSKG